MYSLAQFLVRTVRVAGSALAAELAQTQSAKLGARAQASIMELLAPGIVTSDPSGTAGTALADRALPLCTAAIAMAAITTSPAAARRGIELLASQVARSAPDAYAAMSLCVCLLQAGVAGEFKLALLHGISQMADAREIADRAVRFVAALISAPAVADVAIAILLDLWLQHDRLFPTLQQVFLAWGFFYHVFLWGGANIRG